MVDEHYLKQIKGLQLTKLDRYLFQGETNKWPNGHVYGGQVLGQSIDAGMQSVDDKFQLHSMHAYFLRLGNGDLPIIYEVDPIRDGRSFCTRRVNAIQNGEAIYTAILSFHIEETGLSHQPQMPDVTPPEELMDDIDYYHQVLDKMGPMGEKLKKRFEKPLIPFEMRSYDRIDILAPEKKDVHGGFWFKLRYEGDDDPQNNTKLLGYLSDMGLLAGNFRPHAYVPFDPRIKNICSLDHTFHLHSREFRVDEWMYHSIEGTWTGGARALGRGHIFRRDGKLIATVAQEGLLRIHDSAKI